jgi:hypothetical protein
LLVDALAREKNVDKETVFGALELALASATKKALQRRRRHSCASSIAQRRFLVLPALAGRAR